MIRSSLIVGVLLLAVGVVACSGTSSPAVNDVTFWQDVAPIYNDKCVRCHQEGGIAPFRLDNYADAKTNAALEKQRTAAGTMPPYFMVHDGSCQNFIDDATLTENQKAIIAAWVDQGAPEGTPVTLTLPPQPALAGAVDLTTPLFAPVAQGGQEAEFDEYRCFALDPPVAANSFLTGYAVSPGDASIVHHVITFVVDPQAPGQDGRTTNAAVMQALDDQSPDRLGWPCFGAAGDNVDVSGVPVTWAPGQGIVEYPTGMGVPIKTTDKLVVQIHYNLADPASAGKTDSTTVHLRFAPSVNRAIAFSLPDGLLDTLGKATPDTLAPQQPDVSYTWMRGGRDIGLSGSASVDLVGVMPHMHGRGIRQTMMIGAPGNLACASHLENWDFHWQEFYFYKTPIKMDASSLVQVTCEYDTSADTAPVLPGWGTRNEMCLTVLMVALPPS
jgi:hypothetical protein